MKCFSHDGSDAVGTCKNCNKALCKECAVDTGVGLACRGKCEQELKEVQEIIEFSKSRTRQFKKTGKYTLMIVYVLIAAAVFFGLRFSGKNRTEVKTDRYSYQSSLYNQTELGVLNTFSMDTTILATRKIYFNYDFNEFTCAWLIKLLWLLDSKNSEPINLYICSSGGYISEAKALNNTIRTLKSKVNTFATGSCASSGLRTLAAGTGIRAAYCNSILMFHGDDFDEAKTKNSYDAVAKEIELKDWQKISRVTKAMLEDTSQYNMTPAKAMALGFIDTIICP